MMRLHQIPTLLLHVKKIQFCHSHFKLILKLYMGKIQEKVTGSTNEAGSGARRAATPEITKREGISHTPYGLDSKQCALCLLHVCG